MPYEQYHEHDERQERHRPNVDDLKDRVKDLQKIQRKIERELDRYEGRGRRMSRRERDLIMKYRALEQEISYLKAAIRERRDYRLRETKNKTARTIDAITDVVRALKGKDRGRDRGRNRGRDRDRDRDRNRDRYRDRDRDRGKIKIGPLVFGNKAPNVPTEANTQATFEDMYGQGEASKAREKAPQANLDEIFEQKNTPAQKAEKPKIEPLFAETKTETAPTAQKAERVSFEDLFNQGQRAEAQPEVAQPAPVQTEAQPNSADEFFKNAKISEAQPEPVQAETQPEVAQPAPVQTEAQPEAPVAENIQKPVEEEEAPADLNFASRAEEVKPIAEIKPEDLNPTPAETATPEQEAVAEQAPQNPEVARMLQEFLQNMDQKYTGINLQKIFDNTDSQFWDFMKLNYTGENNYGRKIKNFREDATFGGIRGTERALAHNWRQYSINVLGQDPGRKGAYAEIHQFNQDKAHPDRAAQSFNAFTFDLMNILNKAGKLDQAQSFRSAFEALQVK